MVKRGMLIWLILLLFTVLALPAAAESDPVTAEVTEEWQRFLDTVPGDVADLLPADFFSGDPAAAGKALERATGVPAILSAVGQTLGAGLGQAVRLFARVCGVLLLAAVFRAAAGERSAGGTGAALTFFTALALAGLAFSGGAADLRELAAYFAAVRQVCTALVPLTGALYAMGGNVAAAVAESGVMSVYLALLETVFSTAILPVAGISVTLALADAATGRGNLRPLSGLIKRTVTWCFSLLMLLLCGVLGMQHLLARGNDTLALRTVRFAAGSFLPVAGGSLSEALATVAGSVGYLRATVGVGGVTVLFLLFLPEFLSVVLTRMAFSLSAAAAGFLSCPAEERFLGELASVWGYFLSVIAALFVTAAFSLTLFARAATAL